ncbi:hypothetical protein FOVSG1_006672 [Fusarium oxysporum f. sp. vasinfectum]
MGMITPRLAIITNASVAAAKDYVIIDEEPMVDSLLLDGEQLAKVTSRSETSPLWLSAQALQNLGLSKSAGKSTALLTISGYKKLPVVSTSPAIFFWITGTLLPTVSNGFAGEILLVQ